MKTTNKTKTTFTDAFRTCITLLLPLLANAFTRVGVGTSKEQLTSCLFLLKRNSETCVKTVKSFSTATNVFNIPKQLQIPKVGLMSDVKSAVTDDASQMRQHLSFSRTPIMLWWEDVLTFFISDSSANVIRSQEKSVADTTALPGSSMPSQQDQIPVLERITKVRRQQCSLPTSRR